MGEDGVAPSSEVAKEILSNIVGAPEPEVDAPVEFTTEPIDGATPVVEAPVVDQPAVAPVAVLEPVLSPEDSEAAFTQLQGMGIDMGVKRAELPAEMHGAYDRLMDNVIKSHTEAANVGREAKRQMAEVADFSNKINENPKQVMLTLALQNSEKFAEVAETFERMKEDPEYADLVRREVVAEATMTAAKRQEAVFARQNIEAKANAVRARTQAVAQRLGVQVDIAERVVASRITENNGNITESDIDLLVGSLVPATPVASVTPAAIAAQPPAQPSLAGVGQTPAAETVAAPVVSDSHIRTPIRALLKDAAARVRSLS